MWSVTATRLTGEVDTLVDGGKVMIEGKGLAGATECTISCKEESHKARMCILRGHHMLNVGSDFS